MVAIAIIMSCVRITYIQELYGHQFESLLFESFDHFADNASLDTIRFDHNKASLSVGCHCG